MKFKAVLRGVRPIMFDRYAGDNDTKLTPKQKMYLIPETDILYLPVANLYSCLASENSKSVARKYGKSSAIVTRSVLTHVALGPTTLVMTRHDGTPIKFTDFDQDGFSVVYHTARVKKNGVTIPNPKERPVYEGEWQTVFTVELPDNQAVINEELIRKYLDEAGEIGLGTFRPIYGQFRVIDWEKI